MKGLSHQDMIQGTFILITGAYGYGQNLIRYKNRLVVPGGLASGQYGLDQNSWKVIFTLFRIFRSEISVCDSMSHRQLVPFLYPKRCWEMAGAQKGY